MEQSSLPLSSITDIATSLLVSILLFLIGATQVLMMSYAILPHEIFASIFAKLVFAVSPSHCLS